MSKPKAKRQKNLLAKPKKEELLKILPEYTPGAVNVAFTSEELFNYAQLLSIMSQGLEQMAVDAATRNEPQAVEILQARSKLSAILAGKLSSHYVMGESPSRDVH